MSEKPFWEGKTCKEMAGLHVKATWKNGTIVTGVLDDTGDIDLGDNRSLYTSRSYDSSCDFEPTDNIQSIELLDDPEYERIDNIETCRWAILPARRRETISASSISSLTL